MVIGKAKGSSSRTGKAQPEWVGCFPLELKSGFDVLVSERKIVSTKGSFFDWILEQGKDIGGKLVQSE